MEIEIKQGSDRPIYRQISDQIETAVRDGYLRPGEKLATERELSAMLGVARGTVKKAYEELRAGGFIRIAPGSGCFVLGGRGADGERKAQASELIMQLLKRLEDSHYTHGEIRALFEMLLSERANSQKMVRLATIDCNPESLAVFKEQFSSFEGMEIRMFLIDDVVKYSNPLRIFEDYDIIITTMTHYEQVLGMIYPLRDRLFKAAVSPTQETVIKIVTIPQNAKTGMIVRSSNFKNLMMARLASMNIDTTRVECAYEDDAAKVDKLFLEMDVLIIPHFLILESQKLSRQLYYFEGRGGVTVDFQYQIERGSLIYIEERIQNILSGGN